MADIIKLNPYEGIEIPVNTVFEYKEQKYICVEATYPQCSDCEFEYKCSMVIKCCTAERTTNDSVIFIKL